MTIHYYNVYWPSTTSTFDLSHTDILQCRLPVTKHPTLTVSRLENMYITMLVITKYLQNTIGRTLPFLTMLVFARTCFDRIYYNGHTLTSFPRPVKTMGP